MSYGRTYRKWQAIKKRCCDINDKRYDDYGGRGIEVCDYWKKDFRNFFYDMGEAPDGQSIDRIDNNKGYCKENCRWATAKEQMNNTRSTVFIEHNGEKKSVQQWAEKIGIKHSTLYSRLKRGWEIKEVLNSNHVRLAQKSYTRNRKKR